MPRRLDRTRGLAATKTSRAASTSSPEDELSTEEEIPVRAAARKSSWRDSQSSEEEEEFKGEEDESENSEDAPRRNTPMRPRNGARKPSARPVKASRSGSKQTNADDSENDTSLDDEESGRSEQPYRTRRRNDPPSVLRRPIRASRTPLKRPEPAGSEDDESESKSRSKRDATSDAEFIVESSSSDDGSDSEQAESSDEVDQRRARARGRRATTPTQSRRRPIRGSARKAVARISRTQEPANSSSDDDDLPRYPKPSRSKKRGATNSDDDFVPGGNEKDAQSESEEDDVFDADDDDDSVLDEPARVGHVKNIESFATADDSDDEPHHPSPRLDLTFRRSIEPTSHLKSPDESDSDDGGTQRSPPPKVPPCSSTLDVVTHDLLPAKHVCWFSPDGRDRQCFALDTLRKIALSTMHPKSRTTLTGQHTTTFLQPPHFRTAMSDDLLDQIASRFGREALDLHGSYYTRPRLTEAEEEDEDEADPPQDEENFFDQVRHFIESYMGNQDLYTCPVCYTVAHNRVDGRPSGRGKVDKRYVFDLSHDPMSVLGTLDAFEFEVASTFCFKRVAQAKVHLREDHKVDTRIVKGNEMYARFKIRGQDGLLQRSLQHREMMMYSKSPQRYWYDGNNFEYVLLLSQVPKAAWCREITNAEDDHTTEEVERAEAYLTPAWDFFESFEKDAKALWESIAAPYNDDSGDIEDFLADNSEEMDDDGDVAAVNVYRASQIQAAFDERDEDEALAERYKEMARRQGFLKTDKTVDLAESSEDQDEDDNDQEVSSDEDEEDDDSAGEDEWEQQIRSRRGSIGMRKTSMRKRNSRRVTPLDTTPTKRAAVDPASSLRKRLVIEESDDE